jgi:uncharacterized protein YjiS (DUF1127 family)
MATISRPARRMGSGAGFSFAAARIVETILAWQERGRQRHMLAALDDHMLRDIGLDRAAARREADKPFWRE